MAAAVEQMDAPLLVERSRKTTIPAGTVTSADIAAATSLTNMQVVSPQHQPTAPPQPVDPQTLLLVEGVAAIKALAKNPQNRGPVFAGVAAGVLTAILAVFVHDQTTRGTVSDRLDTQDKRMESVVEVMEGMIDEGEDDMAWMERALAAGFAGKPIPERGASRRKELRRKLAKQ